MNLTKINKFIKYINFYSQNGKKQIITVNKKFEPIFESSSYSNPITSDQIILSIDDTVYIVYTKSPINKISCILKSKQGYVQSQYYLFDMQKITSKYLKFFSNHIIPVKKYLILGLAIGTIPNYIINQFGSSGIIERIDCVDVNSILTKLYQTFFSVSDLIHVYNTTALDFVSTTTTIYDIVLIDIPCDFVTIELMNLIYSITSKTKKILINLINTGIEKINPDILFNKFTISTYTKTDNLNPLKVNHFYVLE
jgi:hypothetical protein